MSDASLYYSLHLFVCTNQRPPDHPRGCCANHESERLRAYLKARADQRGIKNIRVNAAGCLDRCELGPVLVIYPEGVWYGYRTEQDLDEILERHLIKGERVERLLLPDRSA